MKRLLKHAFLTALFLLLFTLQMPVYAKAPKTPNAAPEDLASYGKTVATEKVSLSTPAISQIENTKSGAAISWNKISGADGYIVYRALPADAYYTSIKTISSANTVSFTDTSAKCGQPYHYTLRAFIKSGSQVYYSGYKNAFVNVFLSRPKKPTLKSVQTGVSLKWNKITGASGYLIYRRPYSNNNFSLLGEVSSIYTSCRDISAVNGQKYAYAVRAYASYKGKNYYSYRYVPENYITYKKPSASTDTDPDSGSQTGKTVYRAFLVGEANYISPSIKDLNGPTYDVKSFSNALSSMGYSKVVSKLNLTKAQIMDTIRSTFKDADNNDVSLFYYSGHGSTSSSSSISGSLVSIDGYYITPSELASALGSVNGKIVVLLDSCGSGAAITKSAGESEGEICGNLDPVLFNSQICQAFESQDRLVIEKSGELASSSKFNVITSSAIRQVSIESTSGGISYGWFTYALCKGLGFSYDSTKWSGKMPADSNKNKAVTLKEAYTYATSEVNKLAKKSKKTQDVQRYPKSGELVIFHR